MRRCLPGRQEAGACICHGPQRTAGNLAARADNSDRPLVTARDFPGVTVQWFMGPAVSPEGDRVVYGKSDAGASSRLWISAVTGGPPVQLTDDHASAEYPGSWSLDGNWFAYVQIRTVN